MQNCMNAAIERRACRVVLGDLDYIANPGLIRRHYADAWANWEVLAREVLVKAQAQPDGFVSLYARGRGLTETEILQRLVLLANEYPAVSILLHHFDSEAARPALALSHNRLLLSYVSGESWAQPLLAKLLEQQQPRLVVQPVDDAGIPATAQERLDIVERLYLRCAEAGLQRDDIYVDVLSPSLGVLPFALQVSIDTATLAREHGFCSVAWPLNAGLGHAHRTSAIASGFVSALVQAGLNLAVVSSRDTELIQAIDVANALAGTAVLST